jgi:hypothetical protein
LYGTNAVRVFNKGCSTETEEWDRIWVDIDSLIDRCCQVCGVELSEISKRFCKHVRNCKHVKDVKNYPDNWSFDEKACYLYHLISGLVC